MSYLLDALRKAERERSLGRVPHLAGDHGGAEIDTGAGLPGWLAPLLAGLVVLNLVAIGYFWWSGDEAPVVAESSEPGSVPPQPATSSQSAARPDASEPPNTAQPSATHQEPGPRASASRFSAPPPQTRERPQPRPAADAAPAADFDGEAPAFNELPPAERQALPRLEVNGLLYSSVPGRSFAIINGRRYHEGERTRAGPAIVLIDEDGVVLNHNGTRFRLAAPR